MWLVVDSITYIEVGRFNHHHVAVQFANLKNCEYGGYRYFVQKLGY